MPHTDEIIVDILSNLGKTGVFTFAVFQLSKTNHLKIFECLLCSLIKHSYYMHL